jgi:hypothetical protein
LKEIQEKTNKLPFDRSRQKEVITEKPKKEKEKKKCKIKMIGFASLRLVVEHARRFHRL